MSQSLTGTAWSAFTAKGKTEKRRGRKPGPEWEAPLLVSKAQMAVAAVIIVSDSHAVMTSGSPFSAANAAYNGYLLAKGVRNYLITRRSAQEAPLREFLGADAPANDNLLTPNQSLSNSYNLASHSLKANAVGALGVSVMDTYETGRLFAPGLALTGLLATFNWSMSKRCSDISKAFGPPRMPSLTGKLPPPKLD